MATSIELYRKTWDALSFSERNIVLTYLAVKKHSPPSPVAVVNL